jgi:exodeoxyribonuclease VII small subunit
VGASRYPGNRLLGLPLEEALNEFERGVQLARQGQVKLQQAEQRVQILLSDSEDAAPTPFTPDAE